MKPTVRFSSEKYKCNCIRSNTSGSVANQSFSYMYYALKTFISYVTYKVIGFEVNMKLTNFIHIHVYIHVLCVDLNFNSIRSLLSKYCTQKSDHYPSGTFHVHDFRITSVYMNIVHTRNKNQNPVR